MNATNVQSRLILSTAILLMFATAIPTDVSAQNTIELPIYGSQLMTERERMEHRNRLRSATTAEERERIRIEYHERMRERATERGVTLPDEPPRVGSGGRRDPDGGRGQDRRRGRGQGRNN